MPETPPETYPTLLVIRHGETQWNRIGRLQGHRDSPLTLTGMRQAQVLAISTAPCLPDLESSCLWVSPLGRARQTASILADAWDIPFERFHTRAELAERAYGAWEGRSLEEVRRALPDQYAAHEQDPWGYQVPGGESRTAFTGRVARWLRTLDTGVSHIVVAHSGCLRVLRGLYTAAAPETILRYREPQTSAYRLWDGHEAAIPASPALLRAFGCEGSGRTVGI